MDASARSSGARKNASPDPPERECVAPTASWSTYRRLGDEMTFSSVDFNSNPSLNAESWPSRSALGSCAVLVVSPSATRIGRLRSVFYHIAVVPDIKGTCILKCVSSQQQQSIESDAKRDHLVALSVRRLQRRLLTTFFVASTFRVIIALRLQV